MTPTHQTTGPDAVNADLDTVTHAASTPETEQPWADLGLAADEYARIREILGRRPTNAELAMYSVMWSEHCSYKSSKVHLRQFGEKQSDEMREHLLVGIGENAGVVDIGEDWAVTFKVESHNHPSFVEPYQGAATGVGGIVRDIISMGARPIAVMDALRFGDPSHPDTLRVLPGVVAGISGYGNSLGLPNIGGETRFDAVYQGNPLVNALCVGAMKKQDIHLANASGVGNRVVLFGARTGGDGIGGASVLASGSFDADGPSKRPSVQVGDPFSEKVLIECCLELYREGLVEGIQDLGAAGISCATSELASNGEGGMHIELTSVLLRDPTLNAGEILMSESQERMMAVVTPENAEAFEAVMARWEVEYSWLGEVTDTGRLVIDWQGEAIVDVDPRTVAHDGPVYERPFARPEWLDAVRADTVDAAGLERPGSAADLRATLLDLLGSPNLADASWITDQYDRYVQGNTASAMPDDAGIVRVDEQTGRGVAVSTDCNNRFSYLDPYAGAQLSLAEAFRNVAASGAAPRAVSDCLNFGSPEEPGTMWQFAEAIRGLADGCLELGIPVTGGNVSLYNSTGDTAIHPTPLVAVLGVLDDVARRIPTAWRTAGLDLVLLGETRDELDGSAWAGLHGHLGGVPPQVDLAAERRLGELLGRAAEEGLVAGSHDLSEGGLAVALAEGVERHGTGARVDLAPLLGAGGAAADEGALDAAAALFSESGGRVLVAVAPEHRGAFDALVVEHGVPAVALGTTTPGDSLRVETGAGELVLTASEISTARQRTFRELLAGDEAVVEAAVAEAHGH